ncbi:hypothetical protein COL27_30680, partial [Bacillus sp. AFS075960]
TDPRPVTQQGAIEVSTWSGKISRVTVIGNRVSNTRFDAIRLWGNVSDVRLADNQLAGIGAKPVRVGSSNGCAAGRLPGVSAVSAMIGTLCGGAAQAMSAESDAVGA